MSTKTIKTDAQVREDAEMYLKHFEHDPLMRAALALVVREEVKKNLEKEGKTFDEDSAAETFTACVVVILSLLKEILGIEEECDCAPGECQAEDTADEGPEETTKDDDAGDEDEELEVIELDLPSYAEPLLDVVVALARAAKK